MPPSIPSDRLLVLDGLAGNDPAGGLNGTQQLLQPAHTLLLSLWWSLALAVAVTMILRLVVLPWWRAGRPRPPASYAIVLAPLLAIAALVRANAGGAGLPAWRPAPVSARPRALSPGELHAIAEAAAGRPGASIGRLHGAPAYVALRRGGELVAEGWTVEDGTLTPLAREIRRLHGDDHGGDQPDAIEIAFAHGFAEVAAARRRAPLRQEDRGLLGLEISHGRDRELSSPTAMLAGHLDGAQAVSGFLRRHQLDGMDGVRVRSFEAYQVLVTLGDPPIAHAMQRGNQLVGLGEVTRPRVERLANLSANWLMANLEPDGRMVYGRDPGDGSELGGNNMIRQWMATLALERVAAARGNRELWARIAANIDYDLVHFYEQRGDSGLIRYEGTVKLGALSLAALAIVEHPQRARWRAQERALRRAIDTAWHQDGSFTTFLDPPGRRGQNNFYPGETLLLWAALLERGDDPELRTRFERSFRYYRRWHLQPANRNPAFVPWHTQACVRAWRVLRDPALAEFVFEMNDWLLGVQEWSARPRYPDDQGRFYDPDRPFGPPHASSDGVYLEGLIAAHSLAVELGDVRRAEAYRLAIRRGLRYLLQLQLDDEVDLFFAHDAEHVRGGIRTTPWDARIRVDNVQHGLMALLQILDRWDAAAFTDPPRHEPRSGRVDRVDASAITGMVSVHPALARRARPVGTLELRAVRLSDGAAVWSQRMPAAKLPVRYAVPAGALGPDATVGGVFLEAIYAQADGTGLRGEAWGVIGKPLPLHGGGRADLVLAQLVAATDRPRPPVAAAARDADDPVLVRGTIRPAAGLPVEPGGFVHLRLVSLELGRPFAFRRIENVRFPLTFEVRARDQFYPRALERAEHQPFYVDSTYDPPGVAAEFGLFGWRPPAVTGEAWGPGGEPTSLRLGDQIDLVLDRFWAQDLLRGALQGQPDARSEGWIYLVPGLRGQVGRRNRLVLVLRAPGGPGERIAAVKVYRDVDPDRPLAYHLVDADFRLRPSPDLRVYYSVWLESTAPGGKRTILVGGRASPETPIAALGHDLRVPLTEPATQAPDAVVPDLDRIPLSPTTYR